MKNIVKKLLAVGMLLSMLLAFTGCSSSKSEVASNGAYEMKEVYAASSVTSSSYGYAEDAGAATTAPAAAESLSQNFASMSSSIPENVKLVYTGNVSMETKEFDKSVAELNKFVSDLEGYFENSSVSGNTYRRAEYTIRIPSQNFDSFCNGIGGICTVRNISRSAKDISETYYDTEARLETKKIKLERLQALLKDAQNLEDIIYLESQISDTEYEIEMLSGNIRHYDSLVGYSTITVSITEVYKITVDEAPATDFGSKFGEAFSQGTESFIDGCQEFAIDFAYNWGTWLIIAIIIIINIIIIKIIVKKSKMKIAIARAQNAARQQQMAGQAMMQQNCNAMNYDRYEEYPSKNTKKEEAADSQQKMPLTNDAAVDENSYETVGENAEGFNMDFAHLNNLDDIQNDEQQ